MIGKKYGRLRVEEPARKKYGQVAWLCKCDCGNYTTATTRELLNGRKKSCGCAIKKHGETGQPLYHRWEGIKQRTLNENSKDYEQYGARGITVCPEWRDSYESFRNWALENGYRDDLTLDRIDVNGPYSPENCRWVTAKQQANNRRTNKKIYYNGEEKTIKEWAEVIGIEYNALRYRINNGWSIEKALTTPQRKYGRK